MTGSILSSFGTGSSGGKTSLAMDVDRTLWFANLSFAFTLDHYAVTGNFHGTASYSGLAVHGGEIAQDFTSTAVPEPSTMVSLSVGLSLLLGVDFRRRRRQCV